MNSKFPFGAVRFDGYLYVAGLLIALPWLNPFASGPSAAVTPLLVSWFCAAVLLVLWQPGDWRLCAVAWVAAGLLSSLIALCQFFDFDRFLAPWVNQTELGLAFANLRQRNQFATLTNIAQAALLFGLLCNPLERVAKRWAMLAAAVLAMGTAASSSRTGLVQLVFLVAFALIWAWQARQQMPPNSPPHDGRVQHGLWLPWACVVVIAYALAAWALPRLAGLDPAQHGIFARLTQEPDCSSRRVLWANVLELIAQRPWLGWGWGELDYAHYMHLYSNAQPEQRFCAILDNAHNLPLHLAVELGLPFATIACGAVLWWVLRQRPWAEREPARQMAWSVLALIGLHSLLEFPLWYGPFQVAAGLSLALLLARPAASSPASHPVLTQHWRRPVAVVLVAASTAALAYAAWDYWRISQIYLRPEERSATYREDTLAKLRGSVLFADHVRFAELTLTTLSPGNANQVYSLAQSLLHFSPEPRVIEKLIESATLLGHDHEAVLHLARFRAAFAQEYQAWQARQKPPVGLAAP